jgi:hypothetical protein
MGFSWSIVKSVFSWTPSITTVSALLAIAFGIIGWRAPSPNAFDIAKVFAGAIVGSAGLRSSPVVNKGGQQPVAVNYIIVNEDRWPAVDVNLLQPGNVCSRKINTKAIADPNANTIAK